MGVLLVGGALCRAGYLKCCESARDKLPPTGIKKPCDINRKVFKFLESRISNLESRISNLESRI